MTDEMLVLLALGGSEHHGVVVHHEVDGDDRRCATGNGDTESTDDLPSQEYTALLGIEHVHLRPVVCLDGFHVAPPCSSRVPASPRAERRTHTSTRGVHRSRVRMAPATPTANAASSSSAHSGSTTTAWRVPALRVTVTSAASATAGSFESNWRTLASAGATSDSIGAVAAALTRVDDGTICRDSSGPVVEGVERGRSGDDDRDLVTERTAHTVLERCRARMRMSAVVEQHVDTASGLERTVASIAQRVARERRHTTLVATGDLVPGGSQVGDGLIGAVAVRFHDEYAAWCPPQTSARWRCEICGR